MMAIFKRRDKLAVSVRTRNFVTKCVASNYTMKLRLTMTTFSHILCISLFTDNLIILSFDGL
jgi:hypothetical protein